MAAAERQPATQGAETVAEPASETFVLEHEDHTLANALRFFLNQKCAVPPLAVCAWQ